MENITTANEQYTEHLGKDFARANNSVQAALLNGLFGQLPYVCQGNEEMQMAYLWPELTPRAKAGLVKLAGFAEFD